MIVDLIVKVLLGLITGVLALVPAYTLPDSLADFGSTMGDGLAKVNGVVPVVTLGTCIGIVIAVRVFLFAWSLVVFLYDKLPFKAS